MTVLEFVPPADRAVNKYSVIPKVPKGTKGLSVTVTRENWQTGVDYVHPDTGRVLHNIAAVVEIKYPDGTPGGRDVYRGGLIYRDVSGKHLSDDVPVPERIENVLINGVPTDVVRPAIDILVTEQVFTFGKVKDSKLEDMPEGDYLITVDIKTPVKAGIIVDTKSEDKLIKIVPGLKEKIKGG